MVPNINNWDILFLIFKLVSLANAFFNGVKCSGLNFLLNVSKPLTLILTSVLNSWKPIKAFEIFDLTPLLGFIFFISAFLKKPRFFLFEN